MPTGPDGCPLLGSGHPPAGRSPECAIFAGDSVQFQAGANTGIPSPLRYGWMRTYFERAVKAIGQKELRLHDLRHFMAQIASDAGAPTALIKPLFGTAIRA